MGGVFTASAGAPINNNCTISSVLTVPTISPPIAAGLTLNGYGTTKIALGNTVAINGNVPMPGYLFAAGSVSSTGTRLTSSGQVSWSVARTPGYPVGAWQITFASAHPSGANYMILATGQGCACYIYVGSFAPSSTKFALATFTMGTATTFDYNFSFMVLAS